MCTYNDGSNLSSLKLTNLFGSFKNVFNVACPTSCKLAATCQPSLVSVILIFKLFFSSVWIYTEIRHYGYCYSFIHKMILRNDELRSRKIWTKCLICPKLLLCSDKTGSSIMCYKNVRAEWQESKHLAYSRAMISLQHYWLNLWFKGCIQYQIK